MHAHEPGKAYVVLALNTIAFTVCFACWMINGVLVTYLVENQVFHWTESQVGLLIGTPVLTGALLRLPAGLLTDKYGGKAVFIVLMLVSAVPMYLLSMATEYWHFIIASLGFGLTGASFAVGVAYTSIWFDKKHQGTALGIFGAGNSGAALTSLFAPTLLTRLTAGGEQLDAWRTMPKLYAGILVVTAIVFALGTFSRKPVQAKTLGILDRLAPLKHMRVWRFGLYYFLTFGGFVGLAQWLIPYYVNVYAMSVITAGLMASIFSLPSGLIRALGGVLSDKFGPRRVMYVALTSCIVGFALLSVPRMDIQSPGKGVMAKRAGTVAAVTDQGITIDAATYPLKSPSREIQSIWTESPDVVIWPMTDSWQEAAVKPGDAIVKKQLIARGVTHIYFQANVWILTGIVLIVAFMMGINNAAVYKHIPDYFPQNVGVVGGIVGVIGGLGGFLCPILFGYMLEYTGLWTTCWIFFAVLSAICLLWMHWVIQSMHRKAAPAIAKDVEHPEMVITTGI
ncbi:MAG: NarK/NasA family nitrate transporter [Candidatus Hydrogenedentes bacterium]|nr:NarK/NasA family nitrate transporter [Candidatus Hydrogenedentota bacterium]